MPPSFVNLAQAMLEVERIFDNVLDGDDLGRQERERVVQARQEVLVGVRLHAVDAMDVANVALGMFGFRPVPEGPSRTIFNDVRGKQPAVGQAAGGHKARADL